MLTSCSILVALVSQVHTKVPLVLSEMEVLIWLILLSTCSALPDRFQNKVKSYTPKPGRSTSIGRQINDNPRHGNGHQATKPDFETLFNMTLDIDGKIVGYNRVLPKQEKGFSLNFTFATRSDGTPLEHSTEVNIILGQDKNASLAISISAPYFDDPNIKKGRNLHLWSAVQLFFFNREQQIVKLQLGPHGHHKVVLLNSKTVARWEVLEAGCHKLRLCLATQIC